jgi:hypothetical protein
VGVGARGEKQTKKKKKKMTHPDGWSMAIDATLGGWGSFCPPASVAT